MRRLLPSLAVAVLVSRVVAAQGAPLSLDFAPRGDGFAAAVAEYQAIWARDGARIVVAMERRTGLRFDPAPVRVFILERPSHSGDSVAPMLLRASYPEATKRGTLVHELGHRLLLGRVPENVDDHAIVFLFLYDVWVELWGREFADAQVAVESGRRGGYDYAAGWRAALAIGAQERAQQLRAFVAAHPPR